MPSTQFLLSTCVPWLPLPACLAQACTHPAGCVGAQACQEHIQIQTGFAIGHENLQCAIACGCLGHNPWGWQTVQSSLRIALLCKFRETNWSRSQSSWSCAPGRFTQMEGDSKGGSRLTAVCGSVAQATPLPGVKLCELEHIILLECSSLLWSGSQAGGQQRGNILLASSPAGPPSRVRETWNQPVRGACPWTPAAHRAINDCVSSPERRWGMWYLLPTLVPWVFIPFMWEEKKCQKNLINHSINAPIWKIWVRNYLDFHEFHMSGVWVI